MSAIGEAELTQRLITRPGPGDWLVLLSPTPTESAEHIKEELSFSEATFSVLPSPENAEVLIQFSEEHQAEILVVFGIDNFTEEDWRHLDLNRSRLERRGNAALLLTEKAAQEFLRSAPNLASWIGASIWNALLNAERLSPEEKETRLAALRGWSGHSDEWELQAVQEKTLPRDPEYAEWLVLLGRGDLLER
jgi:hypothetical protein